MMRDLLLALFEGVVFIMMVGVILAWLYIAAGAIN
jgi:hypothetical protein